MKLRENEYRLRVRLAEIFELPRDVVLDLPRFVLLGNLQFFIENHRGIISYTGQEIRVNMNRGSFRIYGRGLQIELILRDELLIRGEIEGIEFLRPAGGEHGAEL